jgi:hypothetical protein
LCIRPLIRSLGRIADSMNRVKNKDNNSVEKNGAATYLIVLSVISVMLLLISLPMMAFMYMGVGMSPGAPHMTHSEFWMFAACPMLIVIIQAIIFRAGQFKAVARGFNFLIALFAAFQLLIVFVVKAAG